MVTLPGLTAKIAKTSPTKMNDICTHCYSSPDKSESFKIKRGRLVFCLRFTISNGWFLSFTHAVIQIFNRMVRSISIFNLVDINECWLMSKLTIRHCLHFQELNYVTDLKLFLHKKQNKFFSKLFIKTCFSLLQSSSFFNV